MKDETRQSKIFSLAEQRLYPHLKITNEKFPRLLVTRKIETDNAEYFGAFLPETGVRFFLDFLSKVFKLRTCVIDVDGNFDVPCPQFYTKRCLAPCVENLCDEQEYAETVGFLRLFLKREKKSLKEKILQKIENFSAELDFETASEWRDKLETIENFWQKDEWVLWLDDAKDNWEIERKNAEIFVYLVTIRGRKTLGKRVFVFEDKHFSDAEIFEQIMPEFYKFHAPSEIRVSADFPVRRIFSEKLSERESRNIKIVVANEGNRKITAERAIHRNKHEFDLKNIKPPVSTKELQKEIKRIFKLGKMPKHIEAFDAAHISGTNSVGSCVVWKDGKFLADEYEFWLSDETSEIKTLETSAAARYKNLKTEPNLVLIDGGSSQLNAVVKALENYQNRKFKIISAVKPPGKHGEISHFLIETGEKILFESGSAAFGFLQNLRDEAHNAANSVHRTRRDFSHFYELAAALPSVAEQTRRKLLQITGSINNLQNTSYEQLISDFDPKTAASIWKDLQDYKTGRSIKVAPPIVPIRYDDPNGDADNLQPLRNL